MLGLVLAVALVGALINLDRKAVGQMMVSQPVVVAPIIGLLLGEPEPALIIGATLQLIFSGSVNVGAALPHHETLVTVVATGAALLSGAPNEPVAARAALAILVAMPLAPLGRGLDRTMERYNVQLSNETQRHCAEGNFDRVSLLGAWSMLLHFATAFVVLFAGLLLAVVFVQLGTQLLPARGLRWLELIYLLLPAAGVGITLVVLRARRVFSTFTLASIGTLVFMLVRGGGP